MGRLWLDLGPIKIMSKKYKYKPLKRCQVRYKNDAGTKWLNSEHHHLGGERMFALALTRRDNRGRYGLFLMNIFQWIFWILKKNIFLIIIWGARVCFLWNSQVKKSIVQVKKIKRGWAFISMGALCEDSICIGIYYRDGKNSCGTRDVGVRLTFFCFFWDCPLIILLCFWTHRRKIPRKSNEIQPLYLNLVIAFNWKLPYVSNLWNGKSLTIYLIESLCNH